MPARSVCWQNAWNLIAVYLHFVYDSTLVECCQFESQLTVTVKTKIVLANYLATTVAA